MRGRHSVQPVALSVSVRVYRYPPSIWVPQWARPVHLQKAGLGLLPLRECADRDLLLEQGASSRCGEAALASFALGTQETIGCGCAHGKQLAAALLSKVEMLMPLQRFDQRGEKGNEAFGADTVGGVPDQEQGMLDFRSRLGFGRCAEAWIALLSHG
jgi:hypothetical protein